MIPKTVVTVSIVTKTNPMPTRFEQNRGNWVNRTSIKIDSTAILNLLFLNMGGILLFKLTGLKTTSKNFRVGKASHTKNAHGRLRHSALQPYKTE